MNYALHTKINTHLIINRGVIHDKICFISNLGVEITNLVFEILPSQTLKKHSDLEGDWGRSPQLWCGAKRLFGFLVLSKNSYPLTQCVTCEEIMLKNEKRLSVPHWVPPPQKTQK